MVNIRTLAHSIKMRIFVTVKPNAKQEKIEKIDENHFIVWVKEPPIKGKANQAIIEALANFFNMPKSAIQIISGFTSKQKTVEIKCFKMENK